MLDTEYFYLAYYDSASNMMAKLDSCRWDNEAPKTMKVVLTDDPDSYAVLWAGPAVRYCYVYEGYFDKPVIVDSTFYLIGSANSNETDYDTNDMEFCFHKPFYYAVVSSGYPLCIPENPMQIEMTTGEGYQWQWHQKTGFPLWGPFLPIVRPQHLVTVHSADSSMGAVSGGAYYPDSNVALLQAVPNYGYRFSHWSDGDSATPRRLLVTSDTVLTAYFESRPFCSLTVAADNPVHGSVTGGGDYPVGDVVSITAVPADELYRFFCWQCPTPAARRCCAAPCATAPCASTPSPPASTSSPSAQSRTAARRNWWSIKNRCQYISRQQVPSKNSL